MNQLVSIGIKVLAAVGVGAAVYFGLDKVAKPKKQEPSQSSNGNCGCGCGNESCNCGQVNNNPNQNYNNHQQCQCNGGPVEMRTEDKIVHGLKTAQEVCSRAFSLCQNLAVAAENIIKIFGRGNCNNNNSYYSGGYNYQGPNNGYHDKYGDPPGFRRISPYILEFVGDGRNNNGGNYCDCNGNYNNNNQGGLW